MVNPVCDDPVHVTATTFPGSGNPVAAFPSGQSHIRGVHFMVGIVVESHVIQPTGLSDKGGSDRTVKQLILLPLRKEYEHALAYHGMVFGQTTLGVPTFGVRTGGDTRTTEVVFRTMIVGASDPAKSSS